MRFARRAPLLLILLSAVLAGCGGTQISAEEVPGEPAALAIPTNEDAAPDAQPAGDDDAQTEDEDESEDEDEDAGADATATAEPGTGGATQSEDSSGATGGTTSGGSGGATPAPTAAPTEAPAENTGGAQADEGLDQFCADNPGAC